MTKIYLILLSILTGCASPNYTKVTMSSLEKDKASCEYETNKTTVQGRYTGLNGIASIPGSIASQLVDSCMKAKGYQSNDQTF